MRESLKNADRMHAINFGNFYVQSYGAAAEWTQVKEAFENWNITSSNAFTGVDEPKTDVLGLEKVVSRLDLICRNLIETKSKLGS